VILLGDCRELLKTLDAGSVRCCVTSPPYWGLRDYGVDGQIGLEKTPEAYVAEIVGVFREVKRVLADDGTLWLNLGDSYMGGGGGNYGSGASVASGHGQHLTNVRNRPAFIAATGLKAKDLVGIPWRVAFALQANGWYLRSDIIWHKPNPMPESVTDRPTRAHEYVFLLSKSAKYFYDADALREPSSTEGYTWEERQAMGFRGNTKHPTKDAIESGLSIPSFAPNGNGRNARTVWTIPTQPTPDAHFATFPEALAERCILAGSAHGDTVLDPFFGSGTVGKVAERLGREWIGCELNPKYVEIAGKKTAQIGMFAHAPGGTEKEMK
jgi:DNA modification methylase